MTDRRSPKVTLLSWGRIEVEGLPAARDYALYPGGGHAWDWGVTGTRHRPGIQPADVRVLVEHGSRVVVLSRGMHRRLETMDETLATLERQGIAVHVLETGAAVALYNRLAADTAVGALLHSTC